MSGNSDAARGATEGACRVPSVCQRMRATMSRKRWLAAIVLVCVSPMAQLVYQLGVDVIVALR